MTQSLPGSTNCKIEYYKNIILVEVPVISNIFTKTPYVPNLGKIFSHAPVVADLSDVFPRQMASILPNTMAFRQKHQPPRRFHGVFKSLFFARKLVPRHPRDVPDMSRRRSYASTPVATLAKRTGAIKFPLSQVTSVWYESPS